jgi:hypothetical protein
LNALFIFAATFTVVFALGFQSLNVNQGHHKAAFLNSLVIGSSNLIVLKMVPEADGLLEIAAYLLGGPFGIVASMLAHRRTIGKNKV